MGVYLDYNASAPIDERVLETMISAYKYQYGNADSRTHNFGEGARLSIDMARSSVASLLGVNKDEVFFTSGATESNNIALLGLQSYAEKTGKNHIITTLLEHKAILESVKHLESKGYVVDYINPDITGAVKAEDVLSKVNEKTLLVSIMHVNNETGIIQPVKEIGDELSKTDVLFHIDATQSCGKLVEEVKELKYNMLTLSAHKMYGPQGVGAIILRKKKYRLPPVTSIMFGGPQEHGIRPGTLPTALIMGFGKACEIAAEDYSDNNEKCGVIKKIILDSLEKSGLNYVINGDISKSVNNTLNVSFIGVSSEALMLSTKQYCGVSNGSACTTSSYSHSHVLTSMGLDEERLESAIRLSWGPETPVDELTIEFTKMLEAVKRLA